MKGKYFTINGILFGSVLSFLLSYLGAYYWLFDYFSHFRMYYFFFFIAVLLFSLWKKDRAKVILFALLSLVIGLEILPFYYPPEEYPDTERLKVGGINVWSSNKEYQRVREFIEKEDFDVFVLQELTPHWEREMAPLLAVYPHYRMAPRTGNYGIGIFSKIPFKKIEELYLNEVDHLSFLAEFDFNKESIVLLGIHTVAPVDANGFKIRNSEFKRINSLVREQRKSTIVIGDLNCSGFSANMNRLTKETGLVDSRYGFGIQNSWHTQMPLVSASIDHCFVSEDLKVTDRRTGPNIGSDHYPLIVELIRE
ncbi:hypothetical protein GWK08_18600 [Leptobacterium flavescens]|uniref:Endonuclease/exonuclease/phosphatase domain-containing protein n=1 Tax=Leptobacterium flavescens TaxID=472055 RepID=A0A6P0UQ58_9FLAO|nr:endonuclease/exonuclease/phosphatase family protein [Leptobacterium flavescens]NER15471.1 hypothetical protein [Leptobacterium flavescens]